MCGRFTLATPADVLAAFFDVDDLGFGDSPHYNIAPTARIATVRNRTGTRRAEATIWGASNPKDGRPIINARSETVATSPLFGRAFANARILVPADGFFEWVKDGRARRARYFHQPGRAPFAFAGIAVEPRKETEEEGAVILTTAASPSVAPVHDRMPVVIPRDAFSLWLNRESRVDAVQRLFEDASRVAWVSHPVSAAVNNVRNDGPGNIAPAAHAPDAQGSLF